MESQVVGMVKLSCQLFPSLASDPTLLSRMQSFMLAAYQQTDYLYGVHEAVEWAGAGYVVPQQLVDSDVNLFRASGLDFNVMVRRRLRKLHESRMNVERVSRSISLDNPYYDRLMELATVGITVHTHDDYVPNTDPSAPGSVPTLSKSYLSASPAVNRCEIEQFHDLGLAFILPKEMVAAHIPGVGLSRLGFALKSGEPKGRPVSDSSHAGRGNIPLNTPQAKKKCDDQFGTIIHPLIQEYIRLIREFVTECLRDIPGFSPAMLIMWKMDLKGAFTLLSFRVEDVRLMANEMTNEMIVFHICGQFGYTGTPMAFNVVSKALEWELKRRLQGKCCVYADDIWGVCRREQLDRELRTVTELCEGLLGPKAISAKKTFAGRRLTIIGWDLDLDHMLLAIADKNVLKAAFGFLSVDLDESIPVTTLERLASWASRYSLVFEEMKPLKRALYAEYIGLRHNVSIPASEVSLEVKRTIRIFRVLFILTAIDEIHFTRPFSWFEVRAIRYIIEFDGSLTGAGFLIYRVDDGDEILMGGAAVDLTIFELGDNSAWQNLCEVTAVLLGLRGLRRLGVGACSVCLRGDSITALTWCEKGVIRSSMHLLNVATILVLQNQITGFAIGNTVHLPAEHNTAADYLSRTRGGVRSLHTFMNDDKFKDMVDIPLDELAFLELCDPRTLAESDDEFFGFWERARGVISA